MLASSTTVACFTAIMLYALSNWECVSGYSLTKQKCIIQPHKCQNMRIVKLHNSIKTCSLKITEYLHSLLAHKCHYFFSIFKAHADILDDAMKGMQVGLLIACEGSELGAIPHEVFDVAVVVEETIVLHNLKDVTLGFAMLMGVIYCINLKYPNDMKYSFEFLQRVVMKIRPDQASPRVHGLRNKILRYKL